MTVLDTFYLLFKTDSRDAGNDVAALDKQISALAAKGKNRDEAEMKQLKELRKQRAEITRDLKDQTKEVDKLGQSFVKTIESVAAAGASLFAFSAIKAGVQHVTDFNSALRVTAGILGQNSSSIAAFANAAELAGGTKEGALGAYSSLFSYYSSKGLKTPTPERLLTALRSDLASRATPEGKALLLQRLGISDTGIISLAESSDADFQRAISKGQDAALTLEQQEKLRELKQAEVDTTQELDHALGVLGAYISGPLISALEGFRDVLHGDFSIIPRTLGVGGGTGWLSSIFGTTEIGSEVGSAGRPGSNQGAIDFWMSQGYSRNQAAAWAAQEQSESSGNPSAYNQGHYGLYQWNEARRRKILAGTGIDVATAGANDQRSAAAWEAEQMGVGASVRAATSTGAASDILTRQFEIPASGAALNAEATKRAILAGKLAIGGSASPAFGSNRGGDRHVTIKTGDINIHTQATDSDGIAAAISPALKNHFRLAISNWDDGVAA